MGCFAMAAFACAHAKLLTVVRALLRIVNYHYVVMHANFCAEIFSL